MELHDDIYTVVEHSDNKVIVELADELHPVFKAHFPQNPILPGYMQIDIIVSILDAELEQIVGAKFMKIVHPKEQITYHISYKNTQTRVEVMDQDDQKISSLKLVLKAQN